jgi:hypothetical protein
LILDASEVLHLQHLLSERDRLDAERAAAAADMKALAERSKARDKALAKLKAEIQRLTGTK